MMLINLLPSKLHGIILVDLTVQNLRKPFNLSEIKWNLARQWHIVLLCRKLPSLTTAGAMRSKIPL
jgi:hypothetical protein